MECQKQTNKLYFLILEKTYAIFVIFDTNYVIL